MKYCSTYISFVLGAGVLSSGLLKAQENQVPDEAFLEFLANMHSIDGELSDPLDMLEIQDDKALNADISSDLELNKAQPQPAKIPQQVKNKKTREIENSSQPKTVNLPIDESRKPATKLSSTEDK
ncbi:hypothetical protein [Aliikangiella sp. IMCC44632]